MGGRVRKGGGVFWRLLWIFGLYKTWGVCWLAEQFYFLKKDFASFNWLRLSCFTSVRPDKHQDITFKSYATAFISRRFQFIFTVVLPFDTVSFEISIFSYGSTAPRGPRPPHFSRFRDHTLTTLGRTPLDEWPARRRDLYLTTHNTHKRQTSMPPAGFEPTIPASERPQTHALDRAATGIGWDIYSVDRLRINK
jgi:hypothetical protein